MKRLNILKFCSRKYKSVPGCVCQLFLNKTGGRKQKKLCQKDICIFKKKVGSIKKKKDFEKSIEGKVVYIAQRVFCNFIFLVLHSVNNRNL